MGYEDMVKMASISELKAECWCDKCDEFVKPKLKAWESSKAHVEDYDCPMCGEILARIPRKVKQKKPLKIKGCTSGRHNYHTYVPWYWKHSYDKTCDICGNSAAWKSGGGIVLCDCHAEDWSRWNDKDGRLNAGGGARSLWDIIYADFREAVCSRAFVPNDFV